MCGVPAGTGDDIQNVGWLLGDQVNPGCMNVFKGKRLVWACQFCRHFLITGTGRMYQDHGSFGHTLDMLTAIDMHLRPRDVGRRCIAQEIDGGGHLFRSAKAAQRNVFHHLFRAG